MLPKAWHDAIVARVTSIPIFDTLRMRIVTLAPGYCEVLVPRKPEYDGVFASFHGGLLMTVADSAACFAILTQTGPEQIMTTTDMSIRFLAPCLSDVRAEAKVIKLGKTLCPVAVDLFDANSKHVAVAQVAYMLLHKMPQR